MTVSTQNFSLTGRGLSCIRDERVLFENLDFRLTAGQILLLKGDNGSGKTSLLRILCGFRGPENGDLSWCGEPLDDCYFSNIAYVGHLDGIKKELTAYENLKVASALASDGRCLLAEALGKVGLNDYRDVPAQALSAGQKRRLALARLLISGAVLWILDEPFTSLDRQGIGLTEQLMAEHCARGGMIILTSHHEIRFRNLPVHCVNLSR